MDWARARWSFFLTSIKTLMVSGCRLAWHREIVLRPPEKTCSTATADPENGLAKKKKLTLYYLCTRYTEKITCKLKKVKKLSMLTHPPVYRIAPLEIFRWKLEVFIQFIEDCCCFALEMGCKVLLRGMRGDSRRGRSLGCIGHLSWSMFICIVCLVIWIEILFQWLEILGKNRIICIIKLHAFIRNPWINY